MAYNHPNIRLMILAFLCSDHSKRNKMINKGQFSRWTLRPTPSSPPFIQNEIKKRWNLPSLMVCNRQRSSTWLLPLFRGRSVPLLFSPLRFFVEVPLYEYQCLPLTSRSRSVSFRVHLSAAAMHLSFFIYLLFLDDQLKIIIHIFVLKKKQTNNLAICNRLRHQKTLTAYECCMRSPRSSTS